MIPFRSTVACLGVIVLLAGCSRAPADGTSLAEAEKAPASAQGWEPVPKSAQGRVSGQPGRAGDPSWPSGAAGPGGNQPVEPAFPEGSLPARQPPVPDEILAAEMEKAEAAAAQQRTLYGPQHPGMAQPSPPPRRVVEPTSPDADVDAGN